jgi:hypothetical protein
MTIHTFGDSHSTYGWPEDMVVSHQIGPLLCYTFGKKRDAINICNYNLNNGDTVIFCLGEIDCRCHIHKHISEDNSHENIINEIVINYLEAIKINVAATNLDLKVYIFNVVPPVNAIDVGQNISFPHLGTDEERKKYTLYFNKTLKDAIKETSYFFFDVYDNYADEYGYLNKELSDGSVHIGNSLYITQFLFSEGLAH